MKEKEAFWVLTSLRSSIGDHTFTCSHCGNIMGVGNWYFTKTGSYDFTAIMKVALQTSPYCCRCGSRMKKDPQLRLKANQHRSAYKAWQKYAITYSGVRVEQKNHWEVDEIVVSPKDICPM